MFRMGVVLTRPSRGVHYRVLYSVTWALGERTNKEKRMVQLTIFFFFEAHQQTITEYFLGASNK